MAVSFSSCYKWNVLDRNIVALVCHFLDSTSLCRLKQLNVHWANASFTPFAWKHVKNVALNIDDEHLVERCRALVYAPSVQLNYTTFYQYSVEYRFIGRYHDEEQKKRTLQHRLNRFSILHSSLFFPYLQSLSIVNLFRNIGDRSVITCIQLLDAFLFRVHWNKLQSFQFEDIEYVHLCTSLVSLWKTSTTVFRSLDFGFVSLESKRHGQLCPFTTLDLLTTNCRQSLEIYRFVAELNGDISIVLNNHNNHIHLYPKLHTIHINAFSDDFVRHIVSSCPVLEELYLFFEYANVTPLMFQHLHQCTHISKLGLIEIQYRELLQTTECIHFFQHSAVVKRLKTLVILSRMHFIPHELYDAIMNNNNNMSELTQLCLDFQYTVMENLIGHRDYFRLSVDSLTLLPSFESSPMITRNQLTHLSLYIGPHFRVSEPEQNVKIVDKIEQMLKTFFRDVKKHTCEVNIKCVVPYIYSNNFFC